MVSDAKVELQLNGTWSEFSPRARTPITINRGRSNWAGQIDSARASMVLDNRDGSLSPDYPAGVNFGNLQRNIPLRVSQGGGDIGLSHDGQGFELASTPDVLGVGGGSPTAPAYAGVTESAETVNTTLHECDLPATLAEGDRLLLLANGAHDSFSPKDQGAGVTDLDDWTLVDSGNIYVPWNAYLIYEIGPISSAQATAMQSGTLEFSTNLGVKSSFQVIRTTGARAGGQGVAWDYLSTASVAFNDNPDPPFLTAPWGADEHRWYAISFYASHGVTVSSNPTNYTAIADGNTTSLVQIASAHRTTPAAGENPSTYTLSGDDNWFAMTFVYRAEEDPSANGVLDITGDIELRFQGEMFEDIQDFITTGEVINLAEKTSGLNGWSLRMYRFGTDLYCDFRWYSSSGRVAEAVLVPFTFQQGLFAWRVTLDVDNGASGYDFNLYSSDSIDGSWTLVANRVGGAVTDITTNDAEINVGGFPSPSTIRSFPGRIDAFRLYDGIGGTVVANPDFTAQALGASSFADSAGRTWTIGTAGVITDRRFRFHGEVSSLPMRQNHSGKDLFVPIEAHGVFRRLRQGNRRIDSVLRRTLPTSEALIQYWPMTEQGDNVSSFGSAVGDAAFTVLDGFPNAAANNDFLSAGAIPEPGDTTWVVDPDTYTGSGAWQIRWLQAIPADETGTDLQYLHVTTTDMTWIVIYSVASGGTQKVLGFRGSTQVYDSGTFGFASTGISRRMTLAVSQNGANVDVRLVAQSAGESAAGGFTDVNAVVGSAGEVTQIRINRNKDIGSWAIGHVTLQNVVTNSSELSDALNAFQGETAADRVARLAIEEGIKARIIGDPADSEPMGPQLSGTLMGLMQEAVDTDLGALYEDRNSIAVAYRTRSSMTGQSVSVALDSSNGELSQAPELDRDDQGFANDVEIINWNGTIARRVLDDGSPVSVSPPPVGAGSYDSEFKVNALNSRLNDLADTRLLLTSVDEPRVSNLGLNLSSPALSSNSALTEDILNMDLGDRITVSDNKTELLGPTLIDQILQGYDETMGPVMQSIDLFTTSAAPWEGGDLVTPPATQFVSFREGKALAYPGSPPHILDVLGYTGGDTIVRSQLDGILDTWVAGTGGTTHNVTTVPEWTTAMTNAVAGDLVRITAQINSALQARADRFDIPFGNMGSSGGDAGLPIIITCADGVFIDPNDYENFTVGLDIQACTHVWPIGVNIRTAQFGLRCLAWGGSAGFPAYVAYNHVEDCGDSCYTFQGWFQDIGTYGGTIPIDSEIASPGVNWGYSEWFVVESNRAEDPGQGGDFHVGEGFYFGTGTAGGGWHSFARDFWCRGNHIEFFTSDAYDCKPGCHRGRFTDNTGARGFAFEGAPFQMCLVVTANSDRPAWFDFDPEIYVEANRIWDSDITNTNASSDHIMGYIGISGIRCAFNVTWAHPQTGTHSAWRVRTQKGTNDTDILDEFRTDPTWIIHQTERGDEAVILGGYGVSPTPFPSAITDIIDVRNCLVRNASPAAGEIDAADSDFVTTVPAVGAAGDAEWNNQGPGSAFDLDQTSLLIRGGESITDLPILIQEDITRRTITDPPTPGAFQIFEP